MTDTLKVALVQTTLVWENPSENYAQLANKIAKLDSDTNLVILPEMFSTGFTMTPSNIDVSQGLETLEWMRQLASNKGFAIVGSTVYKEADRYFNRLLFVRPDGITHSYDKKHTFTLAGEDKVYAAGSERLVFDYMNFKICPLICYDLRFPVWSRNTDNYDVLIYVANWPTPRISAWDALLKARAIENMAYCVGVNRVGKDGLGLEYSGHSAVYDALGEQLAFSEDEGTLYATLQKDHLETTRAKLRFLEDRDSFTLLH